jgi:hypothetical protein
MAGSSSGTEPFGLCSSFYNRHFAGRTCEAQRECATRVRNVVMLLSCPSYSMGSAFRSLCPPCRLQSQDTILRASTSCEGQAAPLEGEVLPAEVGLS